jgi:hypothetical protein
MVGIGMRFTAEPLADNNIEDTILGASKEGMEGGDLRALGVLVVWLGVHRALINVDRLVRAVALEESQRVRVFWAAVGCWLAKDRRFVRLQEVYAGPRIDLLPVGTAFQLQRRGEDERFQGSALRVPRGVLRDRPGDVMSVQELARVHRGYRQRLRMGPSYRADMWAQLQRRSDLSAADLARATYGSIATAWQVRRDFEVYTAARTGPRH